MSTITVGRAGGVVTIVVGDAHRNNALGEADWGRLAQEVTSAAQADGIRAVVLSGHGETFSTGFDMAEWEDADLAAVNRCFTAMEHCFRTIERAPVPVIAAVEGAAIGAGCQLALACDLAVLGMSARIGMPIARLGILASPAFVERITAKTGATLASDLYLTGRLLRADEAHSTGLISRVVADGTARTTAQRLAAKIATYPPAAVTSAKEAIALVTRGDQSVQRAEVMPSVSLGEFRAAVRTFLRRHAHTA
ncbi:enoyl-CoA hydratase/isomerase family protein [Leekyejoonella antrihumi]|uniref:Enoyl-CoA hydratase/isomerase family protein n=1 Tax=Leekyejoonella antrihumi TaxID=1660198 RepID=A0A563E9X6_9MICO|nr:enoyl-CoA hydratase/isomerase family protein [Leekyejoonella antrihumi]TWP38594.1 enoyl-CoA hydratase/isomerase family protein [Leekyejoonella antrihumi]